MMPRLGIYELTYERKDMLVFDGAMLGCYKEPIWILIDVK